MAVRTALLTRLMRAKVATKHEQHELAALRKAGFSVPHWYEFDPTDERAARRSGDAHRAIRWALQEKHRRYLRGHEPKAIMTTATTIATPTSMAELGGSGNASMLRDSVVDRVRTASRILSAALTDMRTANVETVRDELLRRDLELELRAAATIVAELGQLTVSLAKPLGGCPTCGAQLPATRMGICPRCGHPRLLR